MRFKQMPVLFPPVPPEGKRPDPTPPMLVNEISRLFGACVRVQGGEQIPAVMSQNGAKLVFITLTHHEGMTQSELAEATRLKAPTISVVLQKMETAGLVERRADETDRRAVHVYLTELGHSHDKKIRNLFRNTDEILMNGFSPEETQTACALLQRMRDNLLEYFASNDSVTFEKAQKEVKP